jgi:uncharacterized protein YjbI with pentapeptide repeats
MALSDRIQAPDLPELEQLRLSATVAGDDIALSGVLVAESDGPVRGRRVRIRESELRGVVLDAARAPGLELSDVILRDCDLSNVDGREGSIRRVEVHRSRLVGFGLSNGKIQDLRVVDSSLALASFAGAALRSVIFEHLNLSDASFMEARLEGVAFVDCQLAGADFRGAKLTGCAIRGSSLDDVLGIQSLGGLRMPWEDVLGSAGALAAALGIQIEPTGGDG